MVAVLRAVECLGRRFGLASTQNPQRAHRDWPMPATVVGRRSHVEYRMAISVAMARVGDECARDVAGLFILAAMDSSSDGGRRHQSDGRLRPDAGTYWLGAGFCGGQPAGRSACGALFHHEPLVDAASPVTPSPVWRLLGHRRAQRGSYVIEFAFVFLAFFLMLYGIMMYGMIFTAQQSLNLAAQDGARTALQWQSGSDHMTRRANAALAAALQQADWLGSMSGVELNVAVCGATGKLSESGTGACSGLTLADDQLEVVVSYPYGAHPLIPNLLLTSAMVPETLSARGSVRLSDLAGV